MSRAHERFEMLFDANYGDVLAYARRRCASLDDAEDLVAETFAVAWRRIDELPEGDAARLWLFGTARLVRFNQRRTATRQQNLLNRMRVRLQPARMRGIENQLAERVRIERALASLSDSDREVLQLHAWSSASARRRLLASCDSITRVSCWSAGPSQGSRRWPQRAGMRTRRT